MLTKRLEAAKEYLDRNPEAVCIPSGGKGNGELVSEAQAMKAWLVEHGIDENRIYPEAQSRDTVENIRNSKEIMDSEGLPKDMILVSDGFISIEQADRAKAGNRGGRRFGPNSLVYPCNLLDAGNFCFSSGNSFH